MQAGLVLRRDGKVGCLKLGCTGFWQSVLFSQTALLFLGGWVVVRRVCWWLVDRLELQQRLHPSLKERVQRHYFVKGDVGGFYGGPVTSELIVAAWV